MRRLLNGLRGRRRRMERDLGRELADHLERRIDDLVNEGLDRAEARRRARLEVGGPAQVQEAVRDTWMPVWLADRCRDLRVAVRALVRQPGFTATAVLSLAVGIGASAAIFSLVDQVLLRQLPVREPDRLVLLEWNGTTLAPGFGSGSLFSEHMCRGLEQTGAFDGVFCRHPRGVNLTVGTRSEPVAAEFVSGSYFQVLGIQPGLGRLIGPGDDMQPGAHPVVVLSHDTWRTRFNGASDIVGRRVLVNSHPMTVIGVAPATFRGVDLGEVPSLWVPISMKLQALPSWVGMLEQPRVRWLHAFGRLKPGVSLDRASAMLQPWFAQALRADMALEDFPVVSDAQLDRYLASTLTVSPGSRGRSSLRESLDMPLRLLLAGTVLLHLLASLNVASLLLARGAARTREIQTRMALGASRRRVVGLLVTDSLVITAAGALVGVLVAPLVSGTFLTFLQDDAATMAISSRLDVRAFGFACAGAVVTSVLCALALLWQAARQPLVSSLRVRGGQGGSVRLRKSLIVGQVAFTLVLLVAAGLFVQTLARLEDKGPGFSTTNVMTFEIDPRQSGYDGAASRRIVTEVLASLRAQPGVADAAVAGINLLDGGSWNDDMTIAADTRVTTDRDVDLNPVTPNFFDMMGVPIVAGRGFDERDAYRPGESGPFRSLIVNEAFVRRYFGDENPIGRRVGLGTASDVHTDIEIVGVVRDFAYQDIREQTEHGFFSYLEDSGEAGTFYVRMRSSPDAAPGIVRAAVDRVDEGLPLLWARTLDDQVALSLMTERMLATLSGGFGLIALLLSVVGLYGVLAFVVTSRTREIGIRLALGATRASAVWSVVRDALVMLAVGAAIALPCIWGLGRFVEAQLFGVGALDLPTMGGACVVLLCAALVGAMLPAWRAATISPTEALGAE